VTTTLDVVDPNDGRLSLREAITAANANPGADTIIVPAGVYLLALRGADDTNAAGDFDITGSTTFQGAGAGSTVIDGQQIDRVFDVRGTAPGSISVTFHGLTVRNGLADAGGGGGIRVGNADLLVQDCVVTGNRTSGGGGGISNATLPGTGNVTLIRSTVSRNAAVFGGGISALGDAQGQGSVLTASDSTIDRNSVVNGGGGIDAATATLTGCTVTGNQAGIANGGGLFALTATLTDCTVSGNQTTNASGGGLGGATAAMLAINSVGDNAAVGGGGGVVGSDSHADADGQHHQRQDRPRRRRRQDPHGDAYRLHRQRQYHHRRRRRRHLRRYHGDVDQLHRQR
jgi:hypothetical protein